MEKEKKNLHTIHFNHFGNGPHILALLSSTCSTSGTPNGEGFSNEGWNENHVNHNWKNRVFHTLGVVTTAPEESIHARRTGSVNQKSNRWRCYLRWAGDGATNNHTFVNWPSLVRRRPSLRTVQNRVGSYRAIKGVPSLESICRPSRSRLQNEDLLSGCVKRIFPLVFEAEVSQLERNFN